jgi:cytochrome c-type biogenesis protein CcmE
MDPARKRRVRLIVALTAALLLAGALVYTSFSAATEARKPSQILGQSDSGRSYELTGKVVNGSVSHRGETLLFRLRDRDGTKSVPVSYNGVVPDPFRQGREVIVSGKLEHGTFVGQRDSLVTKCPSKFTKKPGSKS